MMKAQPEYDSWRAEEDARTLLRAQEIQSDKKRHKEAQNHAAKQADKFSKIASKPSAKPPSKPVSKPSGGKRGK